jgi:Cellulase (glycosyl hydrolase family 5)
VRTLLAVLLALSLLGCRTAPHTAPTHLGRIVVAADGRGFELAKSRQAFHPWGMNYGNAGRLMEDFWETDCETLAGDFRAMKALGANVVRVHLQFAKFMAAPDRPNAAALERFRRMLRLAEETGLYLDVTGLACYRPSDTPAWYDAMDEPARWAAQARFWEAVAETGAFSPAVFCYDLMNEPVSPAGKRERNQWPSGHLFGGYDFVQYIALDPAGRSREEIVRQWIARMTAAIRKRDQQGLITVGMLPWSRQWKHLSGFVPEKISPQIDFLSVHIYPDKDKPDEALESLRVCAAGKPVVVEETFPLSCGIEQLEAFCRASREMACGWIGHYDGQTPEGIDVLERAGKMTVAQGIYRSWLLMFVRLKPEFAPGP